MGGWILILIQHRQNPSCVSEQSRTLKQFLAANLRLNGLADFLTEYKSEGGKCLQPFCETARLCVLCLPLGALIALEWDYYNV